MARLLATPAHNRSTTTSTTITTTITASAATTITPTATRTPCGTQVHGHWTTRRLLRTATTLWPRLRPPRRRNPVSGNRCTLPGLQVLNQNHLAHLWDQPTHIAVKSLRGPYVRTLDEYPPKRGRISLHITGLSAVSQAVSGATRMINRSELVTKRRSQLLPGQRPDVSWAVLRP